MNLHHANRGSKRTKRGLSAVSRNSWRIITAIMRAIVIKTQLPLSPRAANEQASLRLLQHKFGLCCFRSSVVVCLQRTDFIFQSLVCALYNVGKV